MAAVELMGRGLCVCAVMALLELHKSLVFLVPEHCAVSLVVLSEFVIDLFELFHRISIGPNLLGSISLFFQCLPQYIELSSETLDLTFELTNCLVLGCFFHLELLCGCL